MTSIRLHIAIPGFQNRLHIESDQSSQRISELILQKVPMLSKSDFYITTAASKIVRFMSELVDLENFLQLQFRLVGGKGGYGTRMKNQAISKRKFTNTLAARDLNGKRVRDIKNEIRLKKWLRKKAAEKLAQEAKDRAAAIDPNAELVKKDVSQHLAKVQTSISNSFFNAIQVSNTDSSEAPNNTTSTCYENIDFGTLLKNIENKTRKTMGADQKGENPSFQNPTNTQPQTDKPNYDLETLQIYTSKDQLYELSPDILKKMLSDIGAKCGGTPKERADRLWNIILNPHFLSDKKYCA